MSNLQNFKKYDNDEEDNNVISCEVAQKARKFFGIKYYIYQIPRKRK